MAVVDGGVSLPELEDQFSHSERGRGGSSRLAVVDEPLDDERV